MSTVPIFSGLSQKELGSIFELARVVTYAEGAVIVEEGATGYAFHFILEGSVSVKRAGRIVAKLGPGDFFGEMSFIDDGPRTATITAESDLSTLVLGGWELKPLVRHHPNLAWKLIVHLASRLRDEQSARDACIA